MYLHLHAVLSILRKEIESSGRLTSIVIQANEFRDGKIIYSSAMNSHFMRNYAESFDGGTLFVAIDLYADSNTLSKSGSQILCLVRAHLVNVKGCSKKYH